MSFLLFFSRHTILSNEEEERAAAKRGMDDQQQQWELLKTSNLVDVRQDRSQLPGCICCRESVGFIDD